VGYIAAVPTYLTYLPRTELVFDRFYIVRHLNRTIATVRRQAWRAMSGSRTHKEGPGCVPTR